MNHDIYTPGFVRTLLQSDLVKPQTYTVLKERLDRKQTDVPIFFDANSFELLTSVCKRLIPQEDHSQKVDLPGLLDEKLLQGNGKGWRFNQMPPDNIAYKRGLQGINETAELIYHKEFIMLAATEQDKLLHEIQSGMAKGKIWEEIPAALFFQELLASLTELYYSHPIAKEEIGEVAFADANGWQKIGLNEHEAFDPSAKQNTTDGNTGSAK